MRHCREANLLAQHDEEYDFVDEEYIAGDCCTAAETVFPTGPQVFPIPEVRTRLCV